MKEKYYSIVRLVDNVVIICNVSDKIRTHNLYVMMIVLVDNIIIIVLAAAHINKMTNLHLD